MSNNNLEQSNLELVELNAEDLNGVVGGCNSQHHKNKNKQKSHHNKHSYHNKHTNQASNPNLVPLNEGVINF